MTDDASTTFASLSSTTIQHPLPGTSRYELVTKIAAGGMAMVYVGRLRGAAGFWRLCAIKRAHPHLVEDPELRRSLIAEARLASRIQHPNVVPISDVEELEGELLLVMDYVEGAALSELVRHASDAERRLPPRVVVRVVLDACAGLAAAHDLRDEHGAPLGLVHRDVSPQNVLVGADGIGRIVDFGIAKVREAGGASGKTMTGVLKGKVGYMSPEYVRGRALDARSDVFALGVVLWEALAGARLFQAANEADTMSRVMSAPAPPPSRVVRGLPDALDAVVARALEKSPSRRHASMRELAAELEAAAQTAGLVGSHAEVAAEVEALVGPALARRRALVRSRAEQASVGAASHARDAAELGLPDEGNSVEVIVSDTALRAADATAKPSDATHRARRRALFAVAAAISVALAATAIVSMRTPAAPVQVPAPGADPPSPRESASPAEVTRPETSSVAALDTPAVTAPPRAATGPQARPPVKPRSSSPTRPRGGPAKSDTPDPNPYRTP